MKPSDVARKIFDIEKTNNLFDVTINGIQIYPHVRMLLYYNILSSLDIFDSEGSPSKARKRVNVIINAARYALINTKRIQKSKNKRILIVESNRKDPELKRNIYMYHLVKNFNHKHLVLRFSNTQGIYSEEDKNDSSSIFFDYFNVIVFFYSKFLLKGKISKNFEAVSDLLSNTFDRGFKTKLNLRKTIYTHIAWRYASTRLALHMIKRMNLKLVILEDAYGHSYITNAAKILNIPVIELQHGLIYQYHLGYSYPDSIPGTIDIFPDYLLTFGDYWNKKANYPIKSETISATGFPHFDYLKNKSRHVLRDKHKILFMSQKTIGSHLMDIAIDVARKLPEYTIIYKLHPKQYIDYKKIIFTKEKPMNLILEDGSSFDVYDLFGQCSFLVGVFSTAVYEGLAYGGLKTIICKLPGYEYVEDLISNGDAKLASNADQIVNLIKQNNFVDSDRIRYFNDNAVDNMVNEIESIMKEMETL